MSRLTRVSFNVAAFLALPTAAVVLGFQKAGNRNQPDLLPPMSARAVDATPRPLLDLDRPTVVVLLGTDLTEITDALGPYEIFARAGRYNVVMAAASRRPTLLTGGLRILPHYSLPEIDSILGGPPALVVVPNLPNATAPLNRPVIEWIRRHAEAGAVIHSWCKGAMAIAETGLLDGQTATAHWGDIDALEKQYPAVTWVRGVRWVEHGQFIMSAGISSGIDAALRVLIRTDGDTLARRVANEIRYPDYHFAVDPAVQQYSLRPADFVLLANAAFRVNKTRLAIALYEGVGELDLSNLYDAHVYTMAVSAETVALSGGPVVTAHGVTLYPSFSVVSTQLSRRMRSLERLIVPGTAAREKASSLVAVLGRYLPNLRADYIHADQPERFGLAPVIEDLARTTDVATARFALRRMEVRSSGIRLEGSSLPWIPLGTAIVLGVTGMAAGSIIRRLVSARRHTASHPLIDSAASITQRQRDDSSFKVIR